MRCGSDCRGSTTCGATGTLLRPVRRGVDCRGSTTCAATGTRGRGGRGEEVTAAGKRAIGPSVRRTPSRGMRQAERPYGRFGRRAMAERPCGRLRATCDQADAPEAASRLHDCRSRPPGPRFRPRQIGPRVGQVLSFQSPLAVLETPVSSSSRGTFWPSNPFVRRLLFASGFLSVLKHVIWVLQVFRCSGKGAPSSVFFIPVLRTCWCRFSPLVIPSFSELVSPLFGLRWTCRRLAGPLFFLRTPFRRIGPFRALLGGCREGVETMATSNDKQGHDAQDGLLFAVPDRLRLTLSYLAPTDSAVTADTARAPRHR